MSAQHTPEPWQLDIEAESTEGCRDIIGDGTTIATTHGLEDDAEDLANARLFRGSARLLRTAADLIDRAVTGEAPSGFALVPLEAFAALRSAIANAVTGSAS